MVDHEIEVLVIGAGPTGLGAAVHLTKRGIPHLVIDASDRVGGMAASYTDDHGYTWDLGGHVIHSHFAEFDTAIQDSETPMRRVLRNGGVWLRGDDPTSFVPTPVQAQLDVLPTDLDPQRPSRNLAEYYRHTFGQKLTDGFFSGYNEKMWTLPLERIDHTWTSLRNGGSGRNVPQLGLAKDFTPSTERFPYPKGGTGALWSAIVQRLADPAAIRLGENVKTIEPARHRAVLSSGETIRYRHCISSAPMPWMLRALGLDGDADGLHASTQLAIGLGYRGEPPKILADKSWIYSPDRSIPWFRATMLSNYDPDNAGPGRWNILLEVTRAGKSLGAPDSARRECIASLERIGARAGDLESVWTRRIERGYPVPTLGRDDILRAADEKLIALDIRSRGRFGGWRYESCNQDYSYMQGWQAVASIYDGRAEDVYWNPERF